MSINIINDTQHLPITHAEKQIKKIFFERTGNDTQTEKAVGKHIFVYGYRIFWAGSRICNCHLITKALANPFTIPICL